MFQVSAWMPLASWNTCTMVPLAKAQTMAPVVGSIVLDDVHLTEDQLLAKARDFYAGIAPQGTAHSPPAKAGETR